jgi:endonuclease VIII-like 1
MIITFRNKDESHKLKVGFGRIGSVKCYDAGKIDKEDFDKGAMLRFYTKDKVYVVYDYTKFTLWRWAPGWDTNRSPDPLQEHNQWIEHIYKSKSIEYFKRPLFELMCDQRFFNGIGAFCRTEILARTTFSPL